MSLIRPPRRPEVVARVAAALDEKGGNPRYLAVRWQFVEAYAHEVGRTLHEYRKARGLQHPASLKRRQWKRADAARLHTNKVKP